MKAASPPLRRSRDAETATSHGRAAARSFVWTAIESFGLSGLSLLSLVVLSRILDADDFGAAAMTLGVVQILNLLVETIFHDALVQRREIDELDYDTAFAVNLAVGTLLSALCWLGAETFAAGVGVPKVAALLGPMSLSLPLMGCAASLIAEQRRRMAFRPLALRSLVGRSGGAVLAIGAALAGAGVWSLVVQQVASVGLAALTLWVFAPRRPRLRFSTAALDGLLRFGVKSVAANLVFFSLPRLFITGIGTLLGAAAAGYVTLAFRAIDMLRDLAAGAMLQLSLPIFSRLQDDRAGLERHFLVAVDISTAVMYPVFVGLAVTAPEIVGLLFGTKWLPAAPYFAVVALLTLQYITRMFSAPLMASVGKPHYSLVSGIVQWLIVAIGLPWFGRVSLAAAMTVWTLRLVVSMPIDLLMLSRASGIGVWRQIKGAAVNLALAFAMAVVVLGVKALAGDLPEVVRLVVMVACGAASYGLLVLAFRRPILEKATALAMMSFRSAERRS
ncbi:MAG: hypothetical protein JWL84_5536 [Rhodospirillales bacterium]|nr:hypothetical protein [Rhodospirillales bacterium]